MSTASALAVVSSLFLATACLAQTDAPEAIGGPPMNKWQVSLTPRVWYVAPGGRIRLPGSTSKVALEDLRADHPRMSPAGEVAIRTDDLRFTFRGMNTSQEVTTNAPVAFNLGGVAVAANDSVRTSLDMTVLELSAGYSLINRDLSVSGIPSRDNHLDLWVIGGARVLDYSVKFSRLSPTLAATSKDSTFIDPFIGIRSELQFARHFGAELELAGGAMPGSRSTFNFDVTAAFHYRFCENAQAEVGYRLLISHVKSGKDAQQFRYDGSFAGLFFGVVMRF